MFYDFGSMKKITYLLAILIVSSLVSCEKKNAAPNTTTTTKTTTTDTLSGKIYTIAGNGTAGYSGDGGPATAAELWDPDGVAVDSAGNIYISDLYNERIRKVNAKGIISTIAGNGTRGYSGDGGPATAAEMYYPGGIAVDGSGNVFFVDFNNNCIRKINTSGIISTFAGYQGDPAFGGYSGDGGPATAAELSGPFGIAVDGSGNVYIADYSNDRIRKVNTSGIISTVAGTEPNSRYLGDGGPADSAQLYGIHGVDLDASGNIYLASSNANLIRKVNTSGIISTIAGDTNLVVTGNAGYSGDGGPATAAELQNPTDVVIDGSGNIYIADENNYRIRKINTSGIISTYAGNGTAGYSGDGGLGTAVKIGDVPSIAVDGFSNLYITDIDFNRIRVVYK